MTESLAEARKHLCRSLIQILLETLMGLFQGVKKKHQLIGSAKAGLGFELRNLKLAINFSLQNMIEKLPVEIWFRIVSFMRLIDVFYFSCAAKFTFEICNENKIFKDKKRISKHIVSFDFEIFDFFKSELEILSDNIEKMLKDTIKNSFIFNIIRLKMEKVTYKLLPFRIFDHVFIA